MEILLIAVSLASSISTAFDFRKKRQLVSLALSPDEKVGQFARLLPVCFLGSRENVQEDTRTKTIAVCFIRNPIDHSSPKTPEE